MKRPVLAISALVLALWATGCQPKEEALSSTAAPTASAEDPQARLASLADGQPTFVYFVKEDCGSNPRAIPLLSKLFAAYQGKAKVVGVINTDEAGLRQWKTEYPIGIEFVNDPEKKVIQYYSISTSQTTLLLDADGKESKRFDGFGKDSITALNAEMGSIGKHVASVDLSEAPEHPSYG